MIRLKLHTIAWMLVAILLAGSYLLFHALQNEMMNSKRMYENAASLNTELQELSTLNGRYMAQNQVLTLRKRELEGILPGLQTEIENLKVKLSRTQRYSETAFSARETISVQLKDSTLFDTIKVQSFRFQNENFLVQGVVFDSTEQLELGYRDTLIQVVYYGQRPKPWLWFFSKRPLMQRVSLKNPNARIHYSQVIEIED